MKNKTGSISKKIAVLILIICILSLITLVGITINYVWSIYKSENTTKGLKKIVGETTVFETDDKGMLVPRETFDVQEPTETVSSYDLYKDLLAENPDFVGWITIPGTNIDYPVVQTPEDEQFYLRKDFYGNKSTAGTIFCSADSDLATPSMNIVIYGHHMRAGTMFAQLDGYREKDFYEQHRYIQFNTLYNYGVYEVIGAFETDLHSDTYPYYNFINGTEEEYDEFIENLRNLTPYYTCDSEYGDQFITLSTCSYHTSNARYVVVAKKVM